MAYDYAEYIFYDLNADKFQTCSEISAMGFSQTFLPTLYSIVFIVGFIGNGLVLCVLVKYYKTSTMSDVCLFNLAFSDLLFLISLPFWAHYAAVSEWTFGTNMCHAVTALYTLGFYGSIFFMIIMTLDHYIVIVHPNCSIFIKHRSVRASIAVALFMWALSLGASLPTIIFSQATNETNGWTCRVEYPGETAWRQFSYIEMNLLGLIIPLSVMVFCYSRITPILMHMKSQKRHKAVKLILVLVIIFFLFWTPYNIVIFLMFLHHLGYMNTCQWEQDLNMAMQWVETIAFSHCCLNPIIYAFVAQDYSEYEDMKFWQYRPSNNNVTELRRVFVPTLYSIVFIVGLIGNGLVLCVLFKYRKTSNMSDVCLFNLALSDLLYLISLPFWAYYTAVSKWIFWSFMCNTLSALYMLGFYGSIFFMILMTIERYTVIVHAHRFLFLKHRSVRVSIVLILLIWTLSLGASLPTIIFSQVKDGLNGQTCSVEYPKETAWASFSYMELIFLGWIIPLSVMVFCYSRIIPILMDMKSQKKHKAVRLLLVLVIVFFLFWTPYNIVIFLKFLHHLGYMIDYERDLDMAMQWVETIALSHCCINPIIYAFVGQKFRNLFLKILKEWFPLCFVRCITVDSGFSQRMDTVYSCSSMMPSTRKESRVIA
ncbi:C-C chemokine receptor type 5-like [Silurus meridionalis]|nr:C-C chemokine receptor type 5-like [Silurus meridionalis]